MSRGSDTRWEKGRSGNPAGRPAKRRPHVSAFDIIFDKVLTVTQGGQERELTIDEALQLQTYRAALNGSRMAIRKILKMIEKREEALAKKHKPVKSPFTIKFHHSGENANQALRLLEIADYESSMNSGRMFVNAWATQAALSRPGRKKFSEKDVKDITFFTSDAETLRWPRGRVE